MHFGLYLLLIPNDYARKALDYTTSRWGHLRFGHEGILHSVYESNVWGPFVCSVMLRRLHLRTEERGLVIEPGLRAVKMLRVYSYAQRNEQMSK